MRWYVVHAYSGYEKQVMRALVERIGRSGLEGSSEVRSDGRGRGDSFGPKAPQRT